MKGLWNSILYLRKGGIAFWLACVHFPLTLSNIFPPSFPAEQFGSMCSLERLYSPTHQMELGENSLALMNVEGFQRTNGNSPRSSSFHSIGEAVLQALPRCLVLFYTVRQPALGFLCS